MNYKVVVDSCGELTEEMKKDERFASVPLTLEIEGESIIDDATFDQAEFLKKIAASPNCPKSACPSPELFRKEFDCDVPHIYAVTLSSELSGSYNSAILARNMILEKQPDKKIHVFNSCSASVGETLIAVKLAECEEEGLSFEEIVQKVEAYIESQNTFFVLENLDTLRKSGRLNFVKAFVASALKIKPVMGSTNEGIIHQIDQARGINKALIKMVDCVVEKTVDSKNRILAISHCNCSTRAKQVKDAILEKMPVKDVILLDSSGVTTMYANDGGIVIVI